MEGSDRELKVFQIKFPRISLQTGVLILLINLIVGRSISFLTLRVVISNGN